MTLKKNALLWIGALFVLWPLAGCESLPHPEGKPLPALTFERTDPLTLDVAKISVESLYRLSANRPDFVTEPGLALERYLRTRFTPGLPLSGGGVLLFRIEDVALLHTHEPSLYTVARFLDLAGSERYALKIVLRVEHLDGSGRLIRGTALQAQRIITLSEHASLAYREQRQLEGMEALIADLDARLVPLLTEEMGLRL
jgi:hypothetical protein